VEACGAIDELNAALASRAHGDGKFCQRESVWIQKSLVGLDGRVGVQPKICRVTRGRLFIVTAEMTAKLEKLVKKSNRRT